MSSLIVATLLSGITAQSHKYDEAVGLSLAYVEKALYCGKDRFTRWDVGDSLVYGPDVDYAKVRFVEDNSTKAAGGVGLMTQPDGCFVSLQGSHDKVNGMMDALLWQTSFNRERCPGCMIDFGFSKSYESIKSGIFKALEELHCKQRPLYFVGHSLGAAMVHYALFDALDKGYQVKYVYALESPRPGNDIFAKTLWHKMQGVLAWRTTHYKDLVVHTPDGFNYRHVLPEIYYTSHSGSDYQTCRHQVVEGVPQEDTDCANQWRPWELVLDDHLWYAAMNPTYCQNDTSMSLQSLPAFRKKMDEAPGCLDSQNILFTSTTQLPGAATCGQRITWLRSAVGGSYSTEAAMAEIARLFPGPCGQCATYSESTGLTLAYAVKSMQCGAERFSRWDVGDSLVYGPAVDVSRLQFISSNETDASAGVGRMKGADACFVALKGSDTTANVIINAMFWQSDFQPESCVDCKVVDGFVEGYRAIKHQILAALNRFQCQERPIYLVGHSSGAARVHYLLYDLLDLGYDIRYVFALESPRPGNLAFAKNLWQKIQSRGINAWRTSHYKNAVVHCPASVLSKHVLPEIYYPSHNISGYKKCTWQVVDGVPSEDKLCSNQWRPWEMEFHDPGWYAGVNPTTCSNVTQMSVASLPQYYVAATSKTPQCLSTFNVRFTSYSFMEGVATCGERINWLQSYDGGSYSMEAAMTEVARLFPVQCGSCSVPGEIVFLHSALTFNLMSGIIVCVGVVSSFCLACLSIACCRFIRRRRQERRCETIQESMRRSVSSKLCEEFDEDHQDEV